MTSEVADVIVGSSSTTPKTTTTPRRHHAQEDANDQHPTIPTTRTSPPPTKPRGTDDKSSSHHHGKSRHHPHKHQSTRHANEGDDDGDENQQKPIMALATAKVSSPTTATTTTTSSSTTHNSRTKDRSGREVDSVRPRGKSNTSKTPRDSLARELENLSLDSYITDYKPIADNKALSQDWARDTTFRFLDIMNYRQEAVVARMTFCPGATALQKNEVYSELLRVVVAMEERDTRQWLTEKCFSRKAIEHLLSNKLQTLHMIKSLSLEECITVAPTLGDGFNLYQEALNLYIPRTLPTTAGGTKVSLYRVTFTLDSVSEPLSQFQATINLDVKWIDPEVKNEQYSTKTHWYPRFIFTNIVNPESVTVSNERLETGTKLLKYKCNVQGAWREVFELQRFPLDRQQMHVHIRLGDKNDCDDDEEQQPNKIGEVSVAGFGADAKELWGGQSTVSAKCSEWKMANKLRLEINKNEVVMVLEAQRNGMYYLWNLLLPLFLIVGLGFTAYVYESGDITYKRLMLTTGLISTIVFFKFTTGSAIKTQYLTYMDVYIFMALSVVFGLILGHVLSTIWTYHDELWWMRLTDLTFGTFLGGFWVLLHLFILTCYMLLRQPWSDLAESQKGLLQSGILA
ncbi:hypothetical protein Pelo_18245 [Pelomyxa schiedti]|nr:hypothetical protein Pelo_18245 [Pelomyxa schiedti]